MDTFLSSSSPSLAVEQTDDTLSFFKCDERQREMATMYFNSLVTATVDSLDAAAGVVASASLVMAVHLANIFCYYFSLISGEQDGERERVGRPLYHQIKE